jgi:hypothetical protein
MEHANMLKFLIIGAQKCGTTSAAHNLDRHPNIRVFTGTTEYGQKEIEFFNQHWERGAAWYFSHFPFTSHVQGEKTAELFHRLICHSRIYSTVPDARLIVLLRCPVRRAFSQWSMATLSKRDETRPFETIIKQELRDLNDPEYRNRFYSLADSSVTCWREGYLLKGFYYEQLTHLYRFFPRHQVYVGIAERIIANKVVEYNKMFDFLGLPPFDGPFDEHFVARPGPVISEEARELLLSLYRPATESLFTLVGQEIAEW